MQRKLERYGALNSHDVLKCLALVIMTVDHIGAYLYPDAVWLRAVGRITFPVWFFLVGYASSRKIPPSLWIAALALSALHQAAWFALFPLNALVSIMLSRWILSLCDRYRLLERHAMECWVLLLFFNIPLALFWEYGTLAFMYAMCGAMCRQGLRRAPHKLFWLLSTAAYLFWQQHGFDFSTLQMLYVSASTLAVVWALYHYQFAPIIHQPSAWIADILRYTSRYSLQYYVLHRGIMQLISTYVLLHREQVFTLFY